VLDEVLAVLRQAGPDGAAALRRLGCVSARRAVGARRPARALILPLMLFSLSSCTPPTSGDIARLRSGATTRATYEKLLPRLEELRTDGDLELLTRMRRTHWIERGAVEWPVVVIPSWITSLSGGAPGGISMFGQLVGRSRDSIHGSHVFGYVTGDRIIPRYQVRTQAQLVDEAEYEQLLAVSEPGIGTLASGSGGIYFRDLRVEETRALDFADPEEGLVQTEVEGGLASFYSRERFLAVEPSLLALSPGSDLLGMLRALDARFVTSDYGQSHSLLAPGFLNYRNVRTRSFETRDGIYKLRPFGYVEHEREVVVWIAVFKNDSLLRVVPADRQDDWEALIGE
jgi:hypothetical protein